MDGRGQPHLPDRPPVVFMHRTYAVLMGNPRAYSSGHKRVCLAGTEGCLLQGHLSKFGKADKHHLHKVQQFRQDEETEEHDVPNEGTSSS